MRPALYTYSLFYLTSSAHNQSINFLSVGNLFLHLMRCPQMLARTTSGIANLAHMGASNASYAYHVLLS